MQYRGKTPKTVTIKKNFLDAEYFQCFPRYCILVEVVDILQPDIAQIWAHCGAHMFNCLCVFVNTVCLFIHPLCGVYIQPDEKESKAA